MIAIPNPHFSQAFYCGTTMPRVACVALDLGAQRTASTLPRPILPCALSPRTLVVPRYESCEKCGLKPIRQNHRASQSLQGHKSCKGLHRHIITHLHRFTVVGKYNKAVSKAHGREYSGALFSCRADPPFATFILF